MLDVFLHPWLRIEGVQVSEERWEIKDDVVVRLAHKVHTGALQVTPHQPRQDLVGQSVVTVSHSRQENISVSLTLLQDSLTLLQDSLTLLSGLPEDEHDLDLVLASNPRPPFISRLLSEEKKSCWVAAVLHRSASCLVLVERISSKRAVLLSHECLGSVIKLTFLWWQISRNMILSSCKRRPVNVYATDTQYLSSFRIVKWLLSRASTRPCLISIFLVWVTFAYSHNTFNGHNITILISCLYTKKCLKMKNILTNKINRRKYFTGVTTKRVMLPGWDWDWWSESSLTFCRRSPDNDLYFAVYHSVQCTTVTRPSDY